MKTVDDLPPDARKMLEVILADWDKQFPNTPKEVAVEAFVTNYFKAPKAE